MIKQPTNILKTRILSETSILYLIRHASVIQFADLHLFRRVPTTEHCWKKNSGSQRARTSDLWMSSPTSSRLGGLTCRVGFKLLLYSAIYSYHVNGLKEAA